MGQQMGYILEEVYKWDLWARLELRILESNPWAGNICGT
jgi:hypothetical protein